LPVDIPIYSVANVDLKAPAATQLLESAEYLITVATLEGASVNNGGMGGGDSSLECYLLEQTTKSGKSQLINLRDRLFELEVEQQRASRCSLLTALLTVGA